jgi:hypothetical protein
VAYLTEALQRLTTRTALKGGWRSATMTGAETLDKGSAQKQRLDPGGAARIITLPTVGPDDDGYWFDIANAADAAEDLTVNNAAGVLVVVIHQSELGTVYVDADGAWASFGVSAYTA